MDIDPHSFFCSLNEYMENVNVGPSECNRLLSNLNKTLTKEQLSSSLIDLYLINIFNESYGFANFISKSANKNIFKSCNIALFEILYTLINNFPQKLDKYICEINTMCLKVLKSSFTSSDEKVKALDTLILGFQKIDKCLENTEHYKEVYANLRQSFKIKKTDSVQDRILTALGVFAHKFQYVIHDSDELRNLFLSQLEQQMVDKKLSYKMICGIFTGLTSFCESFPFDISRKEDQVVVGKIYKFVEKLVEPNSRIKIGNRAVLTFLANNMSLFCNPMIEKYVFWHETLLKWLELGYEDQKAGVITITAFYHELGKYLNGDHATKYENVVQYFLDYFKKVLNDNDASNYQKKLTFHGICSFSGVYHTYLTQEEVKDLFMMIMQSFEQTYILRQEQNNETLEYLPEYIKTIANLMHFQKINNSELFCLQKGVINMVKMFPQLQYAYQSYVVDCLVSTFYYLKCNDEKIYESFVENTIYQGVVWTCSHQHISEAEFREEDPSKVITIRNYLNLWKTLLKITSQRNYDKFSIFLHDRKSILVKIVDKLIRTLIILINKLNVSIALTEKNEPTTDIQSAYHVTERSDFAIFLNVVDFYQEIFIEVDPSILRRCICKLIQHLIEKCIKNQFISGFYKLLSFCLNVCNKLNYFDEGNIDAVQDITTCYDSLSKFLEILLNKIKQFKDDLLIACMQVLLECPTTLIRDMLPACIPAFTTIFYVGRSYTSLADMAITTLEKWQDQISGDEIEDFLKQILPILDSFLQSKSLGGLIENNVTENRRKTAQMLKKRKVLMEIEPELFKLQKRILNFVGRQNVALCHAFVCAENNVELAVWGDQEHLKVTFPYSDVKLDVYLDKLVPRIVYLALNSSDRKTRIAACELLQAIVMVFLGLTKQMSQSGLQDLSELLKHITFPLLELGCDIDQVVQQLFQPLFFQLIHWYTHPSQRGSLHGAIIIDAIMDGITHPTKSALRDFSGRCVNEYVTWTIKQTNEGRLANDPVNIKVLMKKMKFFSLHPDPFKKLGAALIFNNIYRELREESSLLSIFWVEFLHIFVKSLSSMECRVEEESIIQQIENALTHIQRGFTEKHSLFNEYDGNRRVPTDIKGCCLRDVVLWILTQTGSKNPDCRRKCMELFINIAPRTKEFKDFVDFVDKNVGDCSSWMRETYESFLMQHPTFDGVVDSDSTSLLKWVQAVSVALDGYNFVLKNNLASHSGLSATLITSIQYYLKNVAFATIDNALSLIRTKVWYYTLFERQEFDKQRSFIVVKTLQLFNTIINNDQTESEVHGFCTADLWSLIVSLVCDSQKLGFSLLTSDNSYLVVLVGNFLRKIPVSKCVEFREALETYVRSTPYLNFDLKSNVPVKQRNIVGGLLFLKSCNIKVLNLQQFATGLTETLLGKFVSQVEGNEIFMDELQDTTIKYCSSILDFAFHDENEFKVFVNYLYKPYKVQSVDNDRSVSFGYYLLSLFEDVVVPKILDNFETFLYISVSQDDFVEEAVELIHFILSCMNNRKQLRSVKEYVCKNILHKWDHLEKYFDTNCESGVEFVKMLLRTNQVSKIDNACAGLKKWLIGLLNVGNDRLSGRNLLDFKIEVFYLLVDVLSDEGSEELRSGLLNLKNNLLSSPNGAISIDKLLGTLPRAETPEFLIFLIELYVISEEQSNVDVKNLLSIYISRNSEQVQGQSLLDIYKMCLREDLNFSQKYKLITNTTPLFLSSNISVFENFFVENIPEVITTLQQATTEDNLIDKIVHFVLVELLFLRCSINGEEISPITQAAFPKNPRNKTLLLQLLKFTLDVCKDSVCCESEEFVRLYRCHGYNAMASIISNSKSDPNFYTKLFIRQENNVDILWTGLIDTNKKYVFENDFDAIPERRKILVNIRDEIRAQRRRENLQSQSVNYVESMKVYESSLSEDLTKFDFTNSVIRSQPAEEMLKDENVSEIQSEIEIDVVDVNNHVCMAIVCGLIEHIVREGVVQLPEEDEEDYKLPPLMKGIRTLLLSDDTHDNIKIFWIKVIDNTMHVFKNFGKWFLEPLLKFVVDKCAGESINYFVTDVVAILASWSTKMLPSEESEINLASELISFLTNHINNERQDMFKYHLELFKLIIESWKVVVRIPLDLLYSKLDIDPTSRRVEVGIHLFSVLLANKITPWHDDNFQDFCKKLFDIVMKNNLKSVYKPAAETIGLTLNLIKEREYCSKIVGNVHKLLKKFETLDRCLDKYTNVLEAIVLHYPSIADEYHLSKLLSRIHTVPPNFKTIYLKIILKRTERLSTLSDFMAEKWENYLESDSLEVKLLALEVIYKCFDIFKSSSQFVSVIKSVCRHITNPNVLCRSRMFDIAILVCQNENEFDGICSLCKEILIQGLTDSDAEIHQKVFQFWLNNPGLSTHASRRFSYVLSNLYSWSTEKDFLGYSSYIMLDVVKQTEEYDDELFEHPLEDCNFEDYKLQANWRMKHLSVVPMFAETLRTYSQNLDSLIDSDFNELRQTQGNLSFAPTQSVRAKEFSQYTISESSLFIKSGEDTTFVNPNLVNISNKYRIPKRRFLKDRSKIQRHFAHQEIEKLAKKVEKRRDVAKERENKITIYRKYRKGDLPDIQITLQALLEPLQALALHDGEISKTLYLILFSSILKKIGDRDEFTENVFRGIKNIFNSSTSFNTNLFQVLLNMIILNKKTMIFDPALITSVCESSGLITLGTVLLEEYLISYEEGPSTSKKARGVEPRGESNYWVKLAELYKEIDEWDVVKSIFLEKMQCKEEIQNALIAESHKQWRDAQELYETLIVTEECAEKRDFYLESYFKCLANLSEWDDLEKAIDQVITKPETTTWTSLWDQDWNQQKLLPWYITTQVKKTFFESKPPRTFLEDLNQIINSDNSDYLQNNFSEEVAATWIFKGEVEVAKQYLNLCTNKFLSQWQLLDTSYSTIRLNKLLKLRNVTDMTIFVKIFQNLSPESEKEIKNLITYWDKTSDEHLPSLLLNETRVLYRKQFATLLENKIKSFADDNLKPILKELKTVRHKLTNYLINAAIDQSNFYMARKYIKTCTSADSRLKFSLARLAYVKIHTMSTNPSEKINFALEIVKNLSPILKNPEDTSMALSAHLLLFNVLNEVSEALDYESLCEKKLQILQLTENTDVISPEDVAEFGARKLKIFVHQCETNLSEMMDDETERNKLKENKIIADAYVKLAYFARRRGEDQFTNFMFSILRGMRFDSSEARQLFPCLLMPKSFSEQNQRIFIEETEKIPVWMFLGWIPQLLVNVDSPKVSIVAPIILRIAKSYPQSIMYAYRLSKENYKFEDESVKNEAVALLEKLDELLLTDPFIDKFLKALSSLSVGPVVLMYYIRKLMGACLNKESSRIRSIEGDIINDVFYCVPDSSNVDSMQGNMYKEIEKFKKDFQKLTRLNVTDKLKLLKNLNEQVDKVLKSEKKKYSNLLKDYCPWLANFSSDKLNVDLEIPGQYDGRKLPLTQHHVKISCFCPNVSVMHSMRKPLKVTILGNNTKEYPFLIKFGEDIRQDQRIQQLFTLMNNILKNENSHRELSILTYQVIPLTTSLGMIQWVDHTISLLGFIKKSIKDKKSLEAFRQSSDKYCNWIYKHGNTNVDAYGRAAQKYSRNETIAKFRSVVNTVEWDVLRSSFWMLSANTEAYSALRNNFIKSYAVMCVSHWILGIGDRHLDNSLISVKNGKVLGIDFGHAFGTATQILPVPELVPFRLTPHIVSLMEPLGEGGLFREIMIHCLRALRSNASSLLATMNVFIEEPSLDWLEHASRLEDGSSSSSPEWYPTQKIEQARRKLEGANPTTIMIEDLIADHRRKESYKAAYVNLVKGLPEFDLRARKSGELLAVEDQVDCLIDQAVDYNLLGRMFHGWTSWV